MLSTYVVDLMRVVNPVVKGVEYSDLRGTSISGTVKSSQVKNGGSFVYLGIVYEPMYIPYHGLPNRVTNKNHHPALFLPGTR